MQTILLTGIVIACSQIVENLCLLKWTKMEISFSTIDKIKEKYGNHWSKTRDLEINVFVEITLYLTFPPPHEIIPEFENATTKDNERGSTAHFWMYY